MANLSKYRMRYKLTKPLLNEVNVIELANLNKCTKKAEQKQKITILLQMNK